MVVAILSTTACDDIDMNQLGILKDKGVINNYEISADKTTMTLYWTYLKATQTIELDLTFVKKFNSATNGFCQRRAS